MGGGVKLKKPKELYPAGDFRSLQCIELLKSADIVVTNPPFSLFREYVAQLIEYDKKFLIIGNVNAITYKEIFSLIKDNKLWLGVSITSGDRKFHVPDSYPLEAAGCGVEIVNGKEKKYIKVKGVRWFVNLENKKRAEILETNASYAKNPEKYPKYDNYDAINVDKTSEIPMDYDGVMGVPITFLDKHNPKQFEILGLDNHLLNRGLGAGCNSLNGKKIYRRLIIRKIAEVEELEQEEREKRKAQKAKKEQE